MGDLFGVEVEEVVRAGLYAEFDVGDVAEADEFARALAEDRVIDVRGAKIDRSPLVGGGKAKFRKF